jgi:hypothetical protein
MGYDVMKHWCIIVSASFTMLNKSFGTVYENGTKYPIFPANTFGNSNFTAINIGLGYKL